MSRPAPLVIAHRGASKARPENTVEAFRAARDLGADWVELDVRRTADRALAVHHDDHLSDGRHLVDLERAALPGAIPDVAAALDACAGMGVNVEIKNHPRDADHDPGCWIAAAVIELLAARRDAGVDQEILISSFDLATIDRARELDPQVPTALLTFDGRDPKRTFDLARSRGHAAVHPHESLIDDAYVAGAHDAGLLVNVWTVDDPYRMRELVEVGVDGIVTNVPDVARRVVSRAGRT